MATSTNKGGVRHVGQPRPFAPALPLSGGIARPTNRVPRLPIATSPPSIPELRPRRRSTSTIDAALNRVATGLPPATPSALGRAAGAENFPTTLPRTAPTNKGGTPATSVPRPGPETANKGGQATGQLGTAPTNKGGTPAGVSGPIVPPRFVDTNTFRERF